MADKVVYILESDPRLLVQLTDAIKQVDSKLNVLSSKNLEGFYLWVKTNFFDSKLKTSSNSSSTPNASPKPTEQAPPQLVLIISQIEFLGPRYFTLLEKAKKMFRRKGISPKDQTLEIVLTTFDSPQFKQGDIESRVINNLIYKPFDQSILEQHLRFALSSHKPVRETTVFKQELGGLKLEVEMLKEVPLLNISELGFTTHSDRPIPLQSVSKYYGQFFQVGISLSVIAKCVECHKVNNDYLSKFSFFGLSNPQSDNIRRFLAKNKSKLKLNPIVPQSNTEIKNLKTDLTSFIILKTDQDNYQELSHFIKEKFIHNDVHILSFSYEELNDPKGYKTHLENKLSLLKNTQFDGVFISINLFYKDPMLCQAWFTHLESHNKSVVAKTSKNLKTFILAQQPIFENLKRTLATILTDIIFTPIDRAYTSKRLKFYFPNLQEKSEHPTLSIQELTLPEVIQAANPIQILQISEAGLVMRYQREIELGSFRRFSLPRPNETENINLLGVCHSYISVKPTIDTQFVFFGVTDKNLKQIRKWILDNHILSKKSL